MSNRIHPMYHRASLGPGALTEAGFTPPLLVAHPRIVIEPRMCCEPSKPDCRISDLRSLLVCGLAIDGEEQLAEGVWSIPASLFDPLGRPMLFPSVPAGGRLVVSLANPLGSPVVHCRVWLHDGGRL